MDQDYVSRLWDTDRDIFWVIIHNGLKMDQDLLHLYTDNSACDDKSTGILDKVFFG